MGLPKQRACVSQSDCSVDKRLHKNAKRLQRKTESDYEKTQHYHREEQNDYRDTKQLRNSTSKKKTTTKRHKMVTNKRTKRQNALLVVILCLFCFSDCCFIGGEGGVTHLCPEAHCLIIHPQMQQSPRGRQRDEDAETGTQVQKSLKEVSWMFNARFTNRTELPSDTTVFSTPAEPLA